MAHKQDERVGLCSACWHLREIAQIWWIHLCEVRVLRVLPPGLTETFAQAHDAAVLRNLATFLFGGEAGQLSPPAQRAVQLPLQSGGLAYWASWLMPSLPSSGGTPRSRPGLWIPCQVMRSKARRPSLRHEQRPNFYEGCLGCGGLGISGKKDIHIPFSVYRASVVGRYRSTRCHAAVGQGLAGGQPKSPLRRGHVGCYPRPRCGRLPPRALARAYAHATTSTAAG